MPPPRDDQYISLSPTESPVDDADIESGVAALGPASQVECQELREGSDPIASRYSAYSWP